MKFVLPKRESFWPISLCKQGYRVAAVCPASSVSATSQVADLKCSISYIILSQHWDSIAMEKQKAEENTLSTSNDVKTKSSAVWLLRPILRLLSEM